MELALSLGDSTKQPFSFMDKASKISPADKDGLGFCMGLGLGFRSEERLGELNEPGTVKSSLHNGDPNERFRVSSSSSSDPPSLQLDLLPFSTVSREQPPNQLRFPWLADQLLRKPCGKRVDVNRPAEAEEEEEDGPAVSGSPPNSAASSFHLEFGRKSKRDAHDDTAAEMERAGSRASDDDDNGSTRKKLRLSKEQSAFLEESFKEHNTLNPKQKLALAKQLNLRPRQVEVWFQNRRARTKLKQTEVDCEYLKRCCETLTEENRRLQKELQELRALKTSRPFYMQLPATTLTMCPSCERVATTTTTTAAGTPASASAATSRAPSATRQ